MNTQLEHKEEQLFAAFLVRCYCQGERWYFLLENVATRERQRFESFAALCSYLQECLRDMDALSGKQNPF
jgi:hypothetical protein